MKFLIRLTFLSLIANDAYACMILTPWHDGVFFPIVCFLLGLTLLFLVLKLNSYNGGRMWRWVVPVSIAILAHEVLLSILIDRFEIMYSSVCGFSFGFAPFIFMLFSVFIAIVVCRGQVKKSVHSRNDN